jgi:hypothetical protein
MKIIGMEKMVGIGRSARGGARGCLDSETKV